MKIEKRITGLELMAINIFLKEVKDKISRTFTLETIIIETDILHHQSNECNATVTAQVFIDPQNKTFVMVKIKLITERPNEWKAISVELTRS